MRKRTTASIAASLALFSLCANAGVDTERMTADSLRAVLSQAHGKGRPQLADKNLANLNLSSVDFLGANLSASVFNGAKLDHARFDTANLTVSFFEGADMTGASFHDAMMFSVQVAGGTLRDADLSGARLIGDLSRTDLTNAKLTHMNAAADMKNQSMGLMHTSLVKAKAPGADFSDSDFSRSEFSFADLTGAKLVNTTPISPARIFKGCAVWTPPSQKALLAYLSLRCRRVTAPSALDITRRAEDVGCGLLGRAWGTGAQRERDPFSRSIIASGRLAAAGNA
jgi:uncharacterized protein YjbI with pentapeptide repeats